MPLWMWPQCRMAYTGGGGKGNYTLTWKSMWTSQTESASYDLLQGHNKKAWPFPSFLSLSAYRHDPVAGQISVAQQANVATNNETFKYLPPYCWDCCFSSLKTHDWLVNGCTQHIMCQEVSNVEWGWLSEKSVQCALSCNTRKCLWQAFQEEDQYNSYHVSHIDHWLCIVICVSNGKPMLLVLKREIKRGQRGEY